MTTLEDAGLWGMKHEVTMGNICSSNNNNNKVVNSNVVWIIMFNVSSFQGGSKPPRDLACLLEEREEEGPWFDLFRQFLRHRDQVLLFRNVKEW